MPMGFGCSARGASAMTDAEILRALIDRSGLSARKFATRVLFRNERTVRRWLAGDPMPAEVLAFVQSQSTTERASPLPHGRAK